MPLRYYKHKETGEIKKSLKKIEDEDYEEIIMAPGSKFMECTNKATGKSKIKGLTKMLKERSRNHSRDVDLDDLIQTNRQVEGTETNIKMNFLNEKGEKRRKIDDI